jgi:hypothetical protein
MEGFQMIRLEANKTNSVAFSLQTKYTDWGTATGQRILVPTFVDRGVSRGKRGGIPRPPSSKANIRGYASISPFVFMA